MKSLISGVFFGILSISSLYAQDGCFTLNSNPGDCFDGVITCALDSTTDHDMFGTTVGNLCDEMSIVESERVALEKELSECYSSYNEIIGFRATEAINLEICELDARILSDSVFEQSERIFELEREVARLKKRLRRKRR